MGRLLCIDEGDDRSNHVSLDLPGPSAFLGAEKKQKG